MRKEHMRAKAKHQIAWTDGYLLLHHAGGLCACYEDIGAEMANFPRDQVLADIEMPDLI
uniref:Uncharacterized protein n=2 Tax=Salmonella sp. TaxID=599 RepID=A0A482EXC6_SALSP|nr:hypothetical protein NNIBIDOC_00186 [Salmonella sp.]